MFYESFSSQFAQGTIPVMNSLGTKDGITCLVLKKIFITHLLQGNLSKQDYLFFQEPLYTEHGLRSYIYLFPLNRSLVNGIPLYIDYFAYDLYGISEFVYYIIAIHYIFEPN